MGKIQLITIGIGTIALGFYLLICPFGINLWDEGIPLYGGERILAGQHVHKDFYGYPPGIYTLYAMIFKYYARDILSVRIVFSVLSVIMPVIAFRTALLFAPVPFALIPPVMLIFLPGIYCNRFSTIFLLLNLWAHLNALSGKITGIFLFCVCITACFLFNAEIGLLSITVIFFGMVYAKFVEKSPSMFRVSLILLAVSLILSCIALRAGMGPDFYKPLLRINKFSSEFQIFPGIPWPLNIYVAHHDSENQNIEKDVKETRQGPQQKLKSKELWFFYFFIVILFQEGFIIIRNFLNPAKYEKYPEKRVVILLYALFAMVPIFMRYGFGYMARYAGPIYILIAVLASIWWKQGKHKRVLLCCFIMLVYMLNGIWNHGFEAGSAGILRKNMVPLPIPKAKIKCEQYEATFIKEIVSYVDQTVPENVPILALPYNPVWYFLADRPNITTYDWLLPGLLDTEKENQMIRQITLNPPQLVIFIDIAFDAKESRRIKNFLPDLYDFILKKYQPAKRIGPFFLLEPRSSTP